MLEEAQIHLGLFDIVLWQYCERFVQEVSGFSEHFSRDCAKNAHRLNIQRDAGIIIRSE